VFDTVYYSITKAIYSLDASKLTFSPSSEGLGENKHETAKLTGLPNGVTATYKYVNVKDTSIELDAPAEVGTYNVVATFSFTDDAEGTALKNNYSNINPASYTYQNAFTVDQTAYNLTGISFNDDTSKIFNKNTQGIAITGTLPDFVKVDYEYYEGTTKLDGEPINAGIYTVKAKFSIISESVY